ncbi:MAG: hypothetical protein ACRDDZ_06215 [Marinifilaceae bacterium]
MTELIEILKWLIPSGSLGAVIVWLTNKTLRNVRTVKEVHDTYKVMYNDTQRTLIEVADENKKLTRAVTKLERTLYRARSCRFYGNCPIRYELHEQTADGGKPQSDKRQHNSVASVTHGELSPGTGVKCEACDSDDEPP